MNASRAHSRKGLRTRRRTRRGATTVEFALVAIPLFLLIFSSVEFGRAMMALQSLEEAARSGCRVAILQGATSQEVGDTVNGVLAPVGISRYDVATTPVNVSTAEQWAPVTVNVTASLNDMSWLPVPNFLKDITYTASCTLPREARNEN